MKKKNNQNDEGIEREGKKNGKNKTENYIKIKHDGVRALYMSASVLGVAAVAAAPTTMVAVVVVIVVVMVVVELCVGEDCRARGITL